MCQSKRFHLPPSQHNIWKPITVFLSVILIVVGLLYTFSDSKTLRASAAFPCSIVVTPDWGKVPKEVVHLKDDYNFQQFEIVSLPSTMEVKRKVHFTSKQNQIAAGTDVVLSDTAHCVSRKSHVIYRGEISIYCLI